MHSHAFPTGIKVCSQGPFGAEGLPPEQAGFFFNLLKPLNCGFAPLAGLEPAAYGLEVSQHPSG